MNPSLKSIDLSLLRHVLDKPVGGSGVGHLEVLSVEVMTDSGVCGLGFSYVLGASGRSTFTSAKELAEALFRVKAPLSDPRACWQMLSHGFNRTGKGPNYLALCALDVALWDLWAKVEAKPLWQYFGAEKPSVPQYQSAGFNASEAADRTLSLMEEARQDGYTAVKLRVAGSQADIARIEAAMTLADKTGMRVMIDVNEKASLADFKCFSKDLADLPVYWMEEPLRSGDLRGYRELAAAGIGPLAAGEHMQGLDEVIPYLDSGSLAIIQPDLAMMGGLSECVRVAREAAVLGCAVSPHFLPGFFVHLAGSMPSMQWLEHFPLTELLFDGWPVPKSDRTLSPGDEPGHGLRISPLSQRTEAVSTVRVTDSR